LKSNFFNIIRKGSTILKTPKIKNISNYNSYILNTTTLAFPLLPKKLENVNDISTDLTKLNISKNDWTQYQCFMVAKNLDIFNNLFNLMKNETTNNVDSGKLMEVHEKIDPSFSANKFISFYLTVVNIFSNEKYQIKKIKSIYIHNFYVDESNIKLKFFYKRDTNSPIINTFI
jgi:hypothetical protein